MNFLRTALAIALLLASICPQVINAAQQRTRAPRYPSTIPAEIVGNLPLITVTWDRHGPWTFLIDTGSTICLFSNDFANRYASTLEPAYAPQVSIESSTGEAIQLKPVTIGHLQLVAAHFYEVPALIYDFEQLSAQLGTRIDGVLSFSLFKDLFLTINYPQSRVVLRDPETVIYPTGTALAFGYRDNRPVPIISLRINDTSQHVLIDTGSDVTFNLNPKKLDLSYRVPPRTGANLFTLAGPRPRQIARIDGNISLANTTFTNPIIELTDKHPSIGGAALRNYVIHFNQQQKFLILSRAGDSAITHPSKRCLGLNIDKQKDRWLLTGTVPDSPASKLNIPANSTITHINNSSISEWHPHRLQACASNDAHYTLTFIPPGSTTPQTLTIPTFTLVE